MTYETFFSRENNLTFYHGNKMLNIYIPHAGVQNQLYELLYIHYNNNNNNIFNERKREMEEEFQFKKR